MDEINLKIEVVKDKEDVVAAFEKYCRLIKAKKIIIIIVNKSKAYNTYGSWFKIVMPYKTKYKTDLLLRMF